MSPVVSASGRNDRTILDTTSPLGIATTRYVDRAASALGGGGDAVPVFEPHHYLNGDGILFKRAAKINTVVIQYVYIIIFSPGPPMHITPGARVPVWLVRLYQRIYQITFRVG